MDIDTPDFDELGAVEYLIEKGLTETQFFECLKHVKSFISLSGNTVVTTAKEKTFSQPVILAKEYIQRHYIEKLTLASVSLSMIWVFGITI